MSSSVSRDVKSLQCRTNGILACSKARTVLAGVAGGMAMSIAMLLTFRLIGFGWNADGILLHPQWQSPKLIAVWTKIEPLPLIISQPPIMVGGLVLFGIGHSIIYRWLSSAWPKGVWSRAWRFSLLTLGMTFLFWEFFTPFNLFGEPLALIGLELVFWTVVAFSEGIALAGASEWLDGKASFDCLCA
jgi:hypothetical protein